MAIAATAVLGVAGPARAEEATGEIDPGTLGLATGYQVAANAFTFDVPADGGSVTGAGEFRFRQADSECSEESTYDFTGSYDAATRTIKGDFNHVAFLDCPGRELARSAYPLSTWEATVNPDGSIEARVFLGADSGITATVATNPNPVLAENTGGEGAARTADDAGTSVAVWIIVAVIGAAIVVTAVVVVTKRRKPSGTDGNHDARVAASSSETIVAADVDSFESATFPPVDPDDDLAPSPPGVPEGDDDPVPPHFERDAEAAAATISGSVAPPEEESDQGADREPRIVTPSDVQFHEDAAPDAPPPVDPTEPPEDQPDSAPGLVTPSDSQFHEDDGTGDSPSPVDSKKPPEPEHGDPTQHLPEE